MDEENPWGGCDNVPGFLTENMKWVLYHKGLYECEVPGVPTVYWGVQDWVRWIDKYGEWDEEYFS